jgi:hypothetical protein
MADYPGEDRRKNGGLSDEQVEAIKQAILNSIYQEIGKSIVRKILWVVGTAVALLLAWLTGSGHIKIPGATE